VDEVFRQINRLLFPGGASDLQEAARWLWKRAFHANQTMGDFFSIWATCLGYEYVVMLVSAKGEAILQSDFDAKNICLPLNLVHNEHSRLCANLRIQEIVHSKKCHLEQSFHGSGTFCVPAC
jgi:hypothetical protein